MKTINIAVFSILFLLPALSMAASINYLLSDNSYYSYSYADSEGSIITDTSQLSGLLQVSIDDSFTTVVIDYGKVFLNGGSLRPVDSLTADVTAISSGTLTSGFTGEFDYLSYGNATLNPFPFICVECGYEMTLNLFADSLVLSYHEFNPYDTGEAHFELFVSQVPLPGAAWLFGSGITGLLSIIGRKRR